MKPGDNKKEISFNEFPLVKSVLESEYFRMLVQFFEQKTNDTPTTTDVVLTDTTAKTEVGCNNKVTLASFLLCLLKSCWYSLPLYNIIYPIHLIKQL